MTFLNGTDINGTVGATTTNLVGVWDRNAFFRTPNSVSLSNMMSCPGAIIYPNNTINSSK